MVQAKTGNSHIERTIPEWQSLGIAENTNKIGKSFPQCIPARQFEDCRSEVQATNPFHMAGKSQCQCPGPTGQIDRPIGWSRGYKTRKQFRIRNAMGDCIITENFRGACESFTYETPSIHCRWLRPWDENTPRTMIWTRRPNIRNCGIAFRYMVRTPRRECAAGRKSV